MPNLAELMSLRGRTALITGALGGIGRAAAETLAELGSDIVLLDRTPARDDDFASWLSSQWNVSAEFVGCDLESQGEREETIRVLSKSGGIDILINNAAFVGTSGLRGWVCPFEQQSIETWRRAMEVNLTAAFHLTQGLVNLLRRSGRGCVINVASIYGILGPDSALYEGTSMGNPAAYAASKGGLIQLTRWLSTTLAPLVRVNAIAPGGISRGQPTLFVERYESKTPLQRMATEDDMRGVIAFLASDMSRYCTGQLINVDGGWSAW